ncbi:cobalt-precorrin-6A reductase [Frateuria aurantia]|uniref:Precorrin-6x reductase n=1 Tax=Frateuria aurantia (strain ATCC 33424 / DSM 6220 / KCTC 2777 / LMG 1558 / NBRC 3245 / NCIMB 13370) TaxID=767434 RepID=H8L516_FRAAD|nr:cobalt-precorrin-6A reductase [Frateuria aurantia]AFC85730.1 precorrin-6x reductase [Frateuria aurantia DSM 6220]
MSRVLVLGGTGEGLALARELGRGDIYSLAGVGRQPQGLECDLRVGGYGGGEGLAAFLREQSISLLIDATHPYAARISANAYMASRLAGIPLWAIRRPGWQPAPADDWRMVDGWAAMMRALADFRRPLFTLGREPLEHLGEIPLHQQWTIRCLDSHPGMERAEVLADRGPYHTDGEQALFSRLGTDVLVSKNSGGAATEAKLVVARRLGLPVVMLRRPALPAADREFSDVASLLQAWT